MARKAFKRDARGVRCVLFCMLEVVEGGHCLPEVLEVLEVLEGVRCMLL
jgi:hypothetical protein